MAARRLPVRHRQCGQLAHGRQDPLSQAPSLVWGWIQLGSDPCIRCPLRAAIVFVVRSCQPCALMVWQLALVGSALSGCWGLGWGRVAVRACYVLAAWQLWVYRRHGVAVAASFFWMCAGSRLRSGVCARAGQVRAQG